MTKSLYTKMSKLYKVQYEISNEDKPHPHARYYHALNSQTAVEMFKATCEESLQGYQVCIEEVDRLEDEGTDHCHWEQVKLEN
jgi:hypothetical protein